METGHPDVDRSYAQALTRFNSGLVARDITVHAGSGKMMEHFSAIFAGNKYFMASWKRDENISLVALLATNDYETVREILDDTWQHQDERTGRLPHIIRAGEPLVYYSSDGTLWALQRLFEYTRQSGDETLLGQKMPMVERFFEDSIAFIQRGLLSSGGIIDKDYLWETWEDTPFTPRAGYPVEIELLWLTVLREFLPYVRPHNDDLADQMAEALEQGDQTFQQFIHDGYLVDSLSYQWEQQQILTPNGYIAFGLDYPLPVELERSMVALGREYLAGLPDAIELPTDRPRPAVASHRGSVVEIALSHELHGGLMALARGCGASLFMALQACLAGLLTRLGAGNDIAIGSPIAGRTDSALDDFAAAIGMDPMQVRLKNLPANDEEGRLLALLSHEPVHIDELSRQTAMAAPTVASTLMMLELKGAVRQVGTMSFVLAH